jgi:hypothetical protein
MERNRPADAETLRAAAEVLATRAKRRTFALRVVIRVLERSADLIDGRVSRGLRGP